MNTPNIQTVVESTARQFTVYANINGTGRTKVEFTGEGTIAELLVAIAEKFQVSIDLSGSAEAAVVGTEGPRVVTNADIIRDGESFFVSEKVDNGGIAVNTIALAPIVVKLYVSGVGSREVTVTATDTTGTASLDDVIAAAKEQLSMTISLRGSTEIRVSDEAGTAHEATDGRHRVYDGGYVATSPRVSNG